MMVVTGKNAENHIMSENVEKVVDKYWRRM